MKNLKLLGILYLLGVLCGLARGNRKCHNLTNVYLFLIVSYLRGLCAPELTVREG